MLTLCKTDTKRLIRLLEVSAEIIEKRSVKPSEADKSRQLRLMSKKIRNRELYNKTKKT